MRDGDRFVVVHCAVWGRILLWYNRGCGLVMGCDASALVLERDELYDMAPLDGRARAALIYVCTASCILVRAVFSYWRATKNRSGSQLTSSLKLALPYMLFLYVITLRQNSNSTTRALV